VALFHSGYGGALPMNPDNVESFLELFYRYLRAPDWSYPLEKAKSILKAERRENEGGNNAVLLRKHRLENVWAGHWCQDVVINHGTEADIEAMNHKTAEDFWQKYYNPANITVYSQGPMDPDDFRKLLDKTGWGQGESGKRASLSLPEYLIRKPAVLGLAITILLASLGHSIHRRFCRRSIPDMKRTWLPVSCVNF